MSREQTAQVEERLGILQWAVARVSQAINNESHPESDVAIRLGEVSASVQRLEWALERLASRKGRRVKPETASTGI